MFRHRGFTLVELMLVMALLGVIISLAIPAYAGYRERVDIALVITHMAKVDADIQRYAMQNNGYPASLADIGRDELDPWGNPYQYLNNITANGNGKKRKDRNLVPINTDYDLYSMGPDGKSVSPLTSTHSRDDIIRANNGAFIGSAEDF